MNSTREIIDVLAVAGRVVVATHEKPDGDALGSALGLCRILRNAGVTCHLSPTGVVASRFGWLVDEGDVLPDLDGVPRETAVLVVLDCGAVDRAAPFVAAWSEAGGVVINIDHHASNTMFGQLNWVDIEYCCVGEMIQSLARDAEWDIPYGAAEALWVATITDTGRFAYQNTSPAALHAAAELLAHPLPTAQIDQRIYNSVSLKQLHLQAKALANLAVYDDGKVAVMELGLVDFEAVGCGPEDAEDFVNIPRSIAGVGVAVFLYEIQKEGADGTSIVTKASLRTTEAYDAAELCRSLSGGGHARAAGCTIPHRLGDASQQLLAVIHERWFQAV